MTARRHYLRLRLLPDALAVCRLGADDPVPAWAMEGELWSVTRTPRELSVIVRAEQVPDLVEADGPWRALVLDAPVELTVSGVLAALIDPLAASGVSVLTVSTFEGDVLLVHQRDLRSALAAIVVAGHRVIGED